MTYYPKTVCGTYHVRGMEEVKQLILHNHIISDIASGVNQDFYLGFWKVLDNYYLGFWFYLGFWKILLIFYLGFWKIS